MDDSGGLHDFGTWAPLLEYLREEEKLGGWDPGPDGVLEGTIGQRNWSMPRFRHRPNPGRAAVEKGRAAIRRVANALTVTGSGCVSFSAQVTPDGPVPGEQAAGVRVTLRVHAFSPAEQRRPGLNYDHFPRIAILANGAVPQPWRFEPDPLSSARPAPTADPDLAGRTLRAWFPDATGATEEEIAACERRLGVTLPGDLKALYRVVSGRPGDWGSFDDSIRLRGTRPDQFLFRLDSLHAAASSARGGSEWRHQARQAVITPPGAPVQGLPGSPGWIVFAHDGSGEMTAVDLTPGPGGHTGQVIEIPHEQDLGAKLVWDSVTDLILGRLPAEREKPPADLPLAVAEVRDGEPRNGIRAVPSVQAAADPALEVLTVCAGGIAPHSLTALAGLPRLRTLIAASGSLADPREITALTGLEYLELGPGDWRALIDADEVPRSLLAAAVATRGQDPATADAVFRDLLTLSGLPQATESVLEGTIAR